MNLCHMCQKHWWCIGLKRLNSLNILPTVQQFSILHNTSPTSVQQGIGDNTIIPVFVGFAPEQNTDVHINCNSSHLKRKVVSKSIICGQQFSPTSKTIYRNSLRNAKENEFIPIPLQQRLQKEFDWGVEPCLRALVEKYKTPDITATRLEKGITVKLCRTSAQHRLEKVTPSKLLTTRPSVSVVKHSLPNSILRTNNLLRLRLSSNYVFSRNCASTTFEDDSFVQKLRKDFQCLRQQNCKYFLKTEFAKVVKELIWPGDSLKHETSQIVEITAGAGVLTRHLLAGGVGNLIVIEKEPGLVPILKQLEAEPGKRYQVVAGDSFTVLRTLQSFKDACVDMSGIFEQKLSNENCPNVNEPVIKVVGSIANKMTERTNLYTLAVLQLQRFGVFKFGPVECNLLMFEKTYKTLTQGPTSYMVKYQAISVLMQIGFQMECLHTVSLSSLLFQEKAGKAKNDRICLVKLTPKMEMFNENNMTAEETSLFIYFVRNMMTKRKQNLLKILEVWAPGSSYICIDLGYNEHTRTGDVKAMDYLRLFTRILKMDSFNGHWIGEDIMDHWGMTDDIENSVLQDMY
ncbi:dimethyladenosine transferase 2, mitochondrial-like isoform X2 [Antedon mediterranea]